MQTLASIGTGLALSGILLMSVPGAAAAQEAHEDLSPCPGSAAEPAQSGTWPVAFCNRTAHDLVIEFHDNECPAREWTQRGDVYQRTLRSGESKVLPLCYANEPSARKLAPGVPMLRIPGGKGVVTTWTVVGDCGGRSKPLNVDARSFYDRGDYKSGIILLQYPSGASHCFADSAASPARPAAATAPASAAAPVSPGVASGVGSSALSAAPAAAAPVAPAASVAPAGSASAAAAAAPVNNRGSGEPTLSVVIETRDAIGRTVRVFAKDGAGYKCKFNLALTFTDGGSWNDRAEADITNTDIGAPIATRKYLKSVATANITSSRCSPK